MNAEYSRQRQRERNKLNSFLASFLLACLIEYSFFVSHYKALIDDLFFMIIFYIHQSINWPLSVFPQQAPN